MPHDAISRKFVGAAKSCLGAKFRLQGRDPSIGLDCVGLIVFCAKACGCAVQHVPEYTLGTKADALVPQLIANGFRPRETLVPQAGDVMIFNMQNDYNHAAVCTGASMIHADMRFRRVVEHHIDDFWRQQLSSLFYLRAHPAWLPSS